MTHFAWRALIGPLNARVVLKKIEALTATVKSERPSRFSQTYITVSHQPLNSLVLTESEFGQS